MDHDLEHKILYPNLKYDDIDDIRQEDESSGSEDGPDDVGNNGSSTLDEVRRQALEDAQLKQAERASRDPFAERQGGPHSGPKAVIADKRHADYLAALSRDRTALQRANPSLTVGGGGPGSGGLREQQRGTEAALARILAGAQTSQANESSLGAEPRSASDEEDEEDAEFLQQYRAQRVAAMQQSRAAQASLQRPVYGSVIDIHDAFRMPEIVDSTPAVSVCLLLLWEPYIQDCLPWVRAWEELAGRVQHVRWVRMRGSTASPEGMDPLGLPSVVAYRGGVEIGVEVRPQDSCASFLQSTDEVEREEEADAQELMARQRRSTARSIASGGSTILGRQMSTSVVLAWAEGKGWLA